MNRMIALLTLVAALMSSEAMAVQSALVGPAIPVDSDTTWATQYGHAIAYAEGPDRYLSVYVDAEAAETNHLRGAIIDPVTGAVTPLTLEATPTRPNMPSVAWNPGSGSFLVAYVRDSAGDSNVYGFILDSSGAKVGGSAPFLISSDHTTAHTSAFPRVASDGSGWMISWQRVTKTNNPEYYRSLRVRQLLPGSSNSTPLFNRTPVGAVNDGVRYHSIAAGRNSEYLIVWHQGSYQNPTNVNHFRVHGLMICPDGTWIGPVELSRYAAYPQVIGHPTKDEFLVAWTSIDPSFQPHVRRYDAGFAPIGSGIPIPLPPDRFQLYPGISLTLAFNSAAGQYLLAWLEGANMIDSVYDVRAVRLDGVTANPLESSIVIANPALDASATTPMLSCASRARDSQTIVQWGVDGTAPQRLQAQRVDLGAHPDAPSVSGAATQHELDDSGGIPAGGGTRQKGFTAKAALTDPMGLLVVLDVEVREADLPLTGSPTASSPEFPSATTASVAISGLARGLSYHWQVRARSANGLHSAWTAYPADPAFSIRLNALPTVSSVGQADASGSPLPLGRVIDASSVRFQGVATDGDAEDDVRFEVELRHIGSPFTGTATAAGPWTDGGLPSAIAQELGGDGGYRWRYRFTDTLDESTSWMSFGGNPESEADFVVMAIGSSNARSRCHGSAGPECFALLGLLPAIAVAVRARMAAGRRP